MLELAKEILRIPTPFNFLVAVVLIYCCAEVITSIAKQIRKFAGQRLELDFKRELLDRGMSIDEVERMVAAKSNSANESE